jgi:hypothetical protein
MTRIFTLSAILLLFSSLLMAQTGFSGSFTLKATQYDAAGQSVREVNLPMIVTPNRIRMIGINRLDPTAVTKNIGANDVLIRLDQQDFVFQTTEKEAMVLKKQELQLMMNMFGSATTTPTQPAANLSVRQTSETKSIQGYTTTKVIMTDRDKQQEYHAWIAKDLDVNLGMFTESWTAALPLKDISSFTQAFDKTGTPLLVETYKDNKKVSQVEMLQINTRFDRSQLEVPAGVKLVTLQEMMLNRMRNY